MAVKPVAERARRCWFPSARLPPGAIVRVVARARLNGRAAVGGRETMRATLTQDTTTLADASAGVRVEADAEFDLGTLLGEVFRDDNGNGRRDRGEPGLGGALVVMDDGLQAVTDAAGRYHLAAVPPGDRAIKLAEYTLPPGSTLHHRRHAHRAGDAGHRCVKIDFGVRVPAPEPPLARPQVSTDRCPSCASPTPAASSIASPATASSARASPSTATPRASTRPAPGRST